MGEIHALWLPEHPDFQIDDDAVASKRLRKSILKRLTDAGARFSNHALAGAEGEANPNWSRAPWKAPRVWALATAALMVLSFFGGALLVRRNQPQPVNVSPNASSNGLSGQATPQASPVKIVDSPRQQDELAALERVIQEAKIEQARLSSQLEEQTRKTTALEQTNAEAARLTASLKQQLEASRDTQTQAEADLTKLRSSQASSEAQVLAQQLEIKLLRDRVVNETARVDRERQLLSAGREIRDLIAARNLHIIDVYDTDGKGKTSRGFGRVFYTEGKSLVFYAYDLGGEAPESSKYAFYVWGKRDGAPQDVRSLGALSKDDQVQKRWVLTVTDPVMLAEIDSVFVTLEPNGRLVRQPSGKRLLSAFLAVPPNHP